MLVSSGSRQISRAAAHSEVGQGKTVEEVDVGVPQVAKIDILLNRRSLGR